jgi:hypothetical protein
MQKGVHAWPLVVSCAACVQACVHAGAVTECGVQAVSWSNSTQAVSRWGSAKDSGAGLATHPSGSASCTSAAAAHSSSSPSAWRCGKCGRRGWHGEWTVESAMQVGRLKAVDMHAQIYQMGGVGHKWISACEGGSLRATQLADTVSPRSGALPPITHRPTRVTRSQRAGAQALCTIQLSRRGVSHFGEPAASLIHHHGDCRSQEPGELPSSHSTLPASPGACVCGVGGRWEG